MPFSLGKLRGPSLSSLIALVRVVAGLGIVAVLLGRSAPKPAPAAPCLPRYPAHPRYFGINPNWFANLPDGLFHLLDTDTGAVAPCAVPSERQVTQVSCSPWHDAEGRFHLVGRSVDKASGMFTLERFTFPAGGASGRLALEILSYGPPCWFPDRSDRILFAGTDHRLYVYDFPEVGGVPSRDPAPLRPLKWQTEPPGVGAFWCYDPCWPSLPDLGGRLLVSLLYREDGSLPGWSTHLWWLQLSPEGDTIVAAERAIVPTELGPSPPVVAEVCPSVGVTREGTPLLAYLAKGRVDSRWELWLMPIEPGASASGRCPRVLVTAARKLADECGSAFLAFSADGRWLYATWRDGLRYRIERYAVPDAAAASSALSAFVGLPGDRPE